MMRVPTLIIFALAFSCVEAVREQGGLFTALRDHGSLLSALVVTQVDGVRLTSYEDSNASAEASRRLTRHSAAEESQVDENDSWVPPGESNTAVAALQTSQHQKQDWQKDEEDPFDDPFFHRHNDDDGGSNSGGGSHSTGTHSGVANGMAGGVFVIVILFFLFFISCPFLCCGVGYCRASSMRKRLETMQFENQSDGTRVPVATLPDGFQHVPIW